MGEIKYIYSGIHVCKAVLLEPQDEKHTFVRYPDRPWVDPVPVPNHHLYDTEEKAMTNQIAYFLNEIRCQKADIQAALENIDEYVGKIDTMLGDYWAHKRAEKQKGS